MNFRNRAGLAAVFISLLWALTLLVYTVPAFGQEIPPDSHPLAEIHPRLQEQLKAQDGLVSFLVVLDEQPDLDAMRAGIRSLPAGAKRPSELLYHRLTEFALHSQAPIRRWLDARGVTYRPFYLVNALEVYGDAAIVQGLRERPDVARLAANPLVKFEPVEAPADQGAQIQTAPYPGLPYGIQFTQAPTVWDLGYRGQGIVVASQDTGADWQHPALIQNYRGWNATTGTADHVYNWFDAWGVAGRPISCSGDPQIPCDDNGHGTHTIGTMVGNDPDAAGGAIIVGMAPDAQWIACRNMNQGNGTPASYIACFQFFLAPYPQGGDPFTDGRPDLAPQIINNSWFCPPSEGCDYESLQQVVQTVVAAGQLIVASAGNSGPGCQTIQYPISAYANVFSVGAHDSTGTIAGFSSRGPVTVDQSGRIKPEITAPGVGVLSSYVGGGYASLSGTSMASPHVAGATALLWSAAPHLIGRLDETEQVLIKSATPVPDALCDPGAGPVTPNSVYGYGRLNAAAAVNMALHPGSLTVVASASQGAVAGAVVTVTDLLTGYQVSGVTDGEGTVVIQRIYAGSYHVQVTDQGRSYSVITEIAADEAATVTVTMETWHFYYFPYVSP